jgi:hypothetical protein
MGLRAQVTVVLLLFCVGLAYERIDGYDELLHYHEQNSEFPIVHVYHNRHFTNSPQYQDFLETIEETEARCGDYARFVMTDC